MIRIMFNPTKTPLEGVREGEEGRDEVEEVEKYSFAKDIKGHLERR